MIACIAFVAGVLAAVGAQHALREEAEAELSQADVERIVVELLKSKPEAVVSALQLYEESQVQAQQDRQRQVAAANRAALVSADGDPFVGNPNASVTLVEFFDYRCGYCKSVLDDVMALVDTDSDLKVVFKEFPILGPESMVATRVSLAVQKVSPKLYADFHRALMRQPGRITEESALRLAESVGADPAAVKTALADPNIGEQIRSNQNLAEKLGIRGTTAPGFVRKPARTTRPGYPFSPWRLLRWHRPRLFPQALMSSRPFIRADKRLDKTTTAGLYLIYYPVSAFRDRGSPWAEKRTGNAGSFLDSFPRFCL